MIPKRAFFTWCGPRDMSWLRKLSIDTFKKHNPEWEVELIEFECDIGKLPAQTTDLRRYLELYRTGGFYFDTDIVFFAPVPDSLLESDLVFTIDKSPFEVGVCEGGLVALENEVLEVPGFSNLAVLGAEPRSDFFRDSFMAACERFIMVQHDNRGSYQLLGINLLNRRFFGKTVESMETEYSSKIYNLPLDFVLPIGWNSVHQLYNGTAFDPPEGCIGVHWYGGDEQSKNFESRANPDTLQYMPCYLTEAIMKANA